MSSTDTVALVLGLQASVPQRMRELPQWLLWRFERYDGDVKPRKVPYWVSGRKRHGVQGSDGDRAELATFDIALTHLARGRFDGLGFAFLPGDGLIGIDIDGAIDGDTGEVSERCQQIIANCASYTEYSPSGRGVHIIVAGQTKTDKDNSIGLEVFCGSQFFTVTGRRWPGAPEQVAPIDEGVLRRLKKTIQLAKQARRKAGPAAGAPAPVLSEQGDLLRRLEEAVRHISPQDYETWTHVGMGLKHALGEGGFRLWDYWSSAGSTYPGSEALSAKWASFRGDGITELTIYKMATTAGWKPPRVKKPRPAASVAPSPAPAPSAPEGQSTPSPACGDQGGGEPPGGPPLDDGPPEEGSDGPPGRKPKNEWRSRLLYSRGALQDCRENVFHMLMEHPLLKGTVAFDLFSHRVLKVGKPPWDTERGEWTTNDDYELGLWLSAKEGLVIKGEGVLAAGVAMAAHRARFHPVKDWLTALVWDETPRLAHWLHECLGAEDKDYHRMVGTFFLQGLVARILDPGCQMDHMIVLEGGQGHGKSSAARVLAGEWFADTPIRIGDKDALLNLAGVLIYEVAELDSFNKAEVTAVKQYVSGRVDRVREPYTRRPADRPRSCVLAGTTNQHEYFKDPTGSRRFWPVGVPGAIDLAKLREWRDQLFAEAVHRYQAGERHYPTRDEEKQYFWPEQDAREIADPWFERVAMWVDAPAQELTTSFLGSEILSGALHVPADRIDGARNMATRVGVIMHKLGWSKARDSTGARLWRYVRPKPGQRAADGPTPGAAAQGAGERGASGGPPSEWSAQDFMEGGDA